MKLRICHLYGNLMNTYGDNGNLLMLQHRAKKLGYEVETTLISLEEDFNAEDFDIVMFGGGQDFEQTVVAKTFKIKKRLSSNTSKIMVLSLRFVVDSNYLVATT